MLPVGLVGFIKSHHINNSCKLTSFDVITSMRLIINSIRSTIILVRRGDKSFLVCLHESKHFDVAANLI